MERSSGSDVEARGTATSVGVTYFTLASSSTIELQARSLQSVARIASGFGDSEVYAYLELEKVA
jgi:hypothetical protein